ncbi:hypothetical protein DFH27DRAFT_557670 [Peziza echinospora]|nr:hypothetical protein DFH27DRAFT_557670 [Peziza echinospora]
MASLHERPVTPDRQGIEPESVSPCPSASTSGVSLYHPASPETPPCAPVQRDGTLAQRRGKSVESLDNPLLEHPIYKLHRLSAAGVKEAFGIPADLKIWSPRKREIKKTAYFGPRDNEKSPPGPGPKHAQNNHATESTDDDLDRRGLPSACMFVANLAATKSDDELQEALQNYFGKIGKLHVKIRRDDKGNPYSFCQFENDEDAKKAIRDGRGAIIDESGRRIRCEAAKVNRTLLLSKIDNGLFDESEARKALFGFGQLESLEFVTGKYTQSRGIRNGCYVRFAYRQDAVDCHQSFRSHNVWSVEWANNIPPVAKPSSSSQQYMATVDQFSIFIGQLNPELVTREIVIERFSKHGKILECNLIVKPGRNAFAFVKYENAISATMAIEQENQMLFLGKTIQVQRREFHEKNARLNDNYPFALHAIGDHRVPAQPVAFSVHDVADLAARLTLNYAQFNQRPPHLLGMGGMGGMGRNFNSDAIAGAQTPSMFMQAPFFPPYFYSPPPQHSAMANSGKISGQHATKEPHSPLYAIDTHTQETHAFQPHSFEGNYGSFSPYHHHSVGHDHRYTNQYSPDGYDEVPTSHHQN